MNQIASAWNVIHALSNKVFFNVVLLMSVRAAVFCILSADRIQSSVFLSKH